MSFGEPDYFQASGPFEQWHEAAAPEEKRLYKTVCRYERAYFEDMALKPGSVIGDFVFYQEKNRAGKLVEKKYDWYNQPRLSGVYTWHIKPLKPNVGASCISGKYSFEVSPDHVKNTPLILHEMIHGFENILADDYYREKREVLFLCLYNDLRNKKRRLDQWILNHGHFKAQEIFEGEGEHGLLFFLKSLDLDLRLGLKPGTVCGYGTDKILSKK
jgi:hypothetical protein